MVEVAFESHQLELAALHHVAAPAPVQEADRLECSLPLPLPLDWPDEDPFQVLLDVSQLEEEEYQASPEYSSEGAQD